MPTRRNVKSGIREESRNSACSFLELGMELLSLNVSFSKM
jgi:hypothetical protein